jgi:hypothetical protein
MEIEDLQVNSKERKNFFRLNEYTQNQEIEDLEDNPKNWKQITSPFPCAFVSHSNISEMRKKKKRDEEENVLLGTKKKFSLLFSV